MDPDVQAKQLLARIAQGEYRLIVNYRSVWVDRPLTVARHALVDTYPRQLIVTSYHSDVAASDIAHNHIDPYRTMTVTPGFLRTQQDTLARQRYDAILVERVGDLGPKTTAALMAVIAGHSADTPVVLCMPRSYSTTVSRRARWILACPTRHSTVDTRDLREILT